MKSGFGFYWKRWITAQRFGCGGERKYQFKTYYKALNIIASI